MNSRERILAALNHCEPDRVPFDLGSCQVTSIHVVAYQNLRNALGLPQVDIKICDVVQQLASIDEDVITRLVIDTRGLYPLSSHNWQVVDQNAGDYWQTALAELGDLVDAVTYADDTAPRNHRSYHPTCCAGYSNHASSFCLKLL